MSYFAILLTCVGCLWFVFRRLRATHLLSPSNLTPIQIARRCKVYLRQHGIESFVLLPHIREGNQCGEGPVNLRVPNEQFGKRFGRVKLICRDQDFIAGESFFKDIADHRTKIADKTSLFIVVTTSPPSYRNAAMGESYRVAVIDLHGLHEVVKSLTAVKAGMKPAYAGRSAIIARAFNG